MARYCIKPPDPSARRGITWHQRIVSQVSVVSKVSLVKLSQAQVTEFPKSFHLFYALSSNNGFKSLTNSSSDSRTNGH